MAFSGGGIGSTAALASRHPLQLSASKSLHVIKRKRLEKSLKPVQKLLPKGRG